MGTTEVVSRKTYVVELSPGAMAVVRLFKSGSTASRRGTGGTACLGVIRLANEERRLDFDLVGYGSGLSVWQGVGQCRHEVGGGLWRFLIPGDVRGMGECKNRMACSFKGKAATRRRFWK